MTREEACRLIDPATDLDELDKIIYYHGFNGKKVAGQKLREASQMLVDYVRSSASEFWSQTKDSSPDANVIDDNGDLRSDAVLVFTRDGTQLAAYYWKNFGWTGVIDKHSIYPTGYVTHWRKLPKPPALVVFFEQGVKKDE